MVLWVILRLCRAKPKLPKMPWLLRFPVLMALGKPFFSSLILVTCVESKPFLKKQSFYWKIHMVKNTYDWTGRFWFKFFRIWRILWPGHVLHPLRCISCCSVIERSSLLVFKSPRFSKSSQELIVNLLWCFDLNYWQVRRLYGNTCKGSLCLPWLACRWASEGHCVV